MQHIDRCVAGDGSEIAYAVSGEGPPLVLPAWWVSDLERDWESPNSRKLFDLLGKRQTVIRYDRPGVGVSGGERDSFTIEDEVRYLETVVRHVDVGPVSMLAMSCGGPPAISLAVDSPELVRALVLYASYPCGRRLAKSDSRDALVAFVRSMWGTVGSRTMSDMFKPGATRSEMKEFADYQREVSTPDTAAELMRLTFDMDVSDVAPLLECPVLVLHRSSDAVVPARFGRDLVELIPGARHVEFDGSDHHMADGDSDALVREVERFLLGNSSLDLVDRRLATVLFTDIVESTPLVARLGDEAWRSRLDEHDRIVESTVVDYGGHLVKSTGDGVLGLFELPTQAARCARALHDAVAPLDLALRVGLHTGEIELRGDDVLGVAVHVAARVQAEAGPGMTLATSTVRELSAGGGIEFEPYVTTALRGVGGDWTLFDCS